jgi:hypothetical protein
VYLIIKETLYSFTPLQVKPIKTVQGINCEASYYSRGFLYYSSFGVVESSEVEELTSPM